MFFPFIPFRSVVVLQHIYFNQHLCVSPYEIKFSYVVLVGGVLGFTCLDKVYDLFEGCVKIQTIANDITNKYPPLPVNIFYCLEGIKLVFLVQVAPGFIIIFYYHSTITEVFSLVQYIMTKANFGWLTRSVSSSLVSKYDGPKMILHVFCVYLKCSF